MTKFNMATKCRFNSAIGKVILPVEPGSSLANDLSDYAADLAARVAADEDQRSVGVNAGGVAPAPMSSIPHQLRVRGTPRKSLGSVAKRASSSKSNKSRR
jgi:hypothetical protein